MSQASFWRHDVSDALFQRLCLWEAAVSEAVPNKHPRGVGGHLDEHLERARDEGRSEDDGVDERLVGAGRLGREGLQQLLLVPGCPEDPVALDAVEDGHERVSDGVLRLVGV